MLNQQNTNLSHGNVETDASTGLMDFIQDVKDVHTEKDSDKEELQAEEEKACSKEEKDIHIESRLNKKVERYREEKNQMIEKEDGLSVPDVSSPLPSTCEFSQDHVVPQERYLNIQSS